MNRKSLFMPVAFALAFLTTGCEKGQLETSSTSDTLDLSWRDTIVINFGFGSSATRATISEAKMSDLWVFDTMNGELKQTIHQQKTDDGFGSVSVAVEYGAHTFYLLASAGTEPVVNGSEVTWTKPGDTFYSTADVDVQPQGTKQVDVSMNRIATRFRITVDDEIPADFTALSISGSWYYGLNWLSGEAVGLQTSERTINVPASYVGTTGQLTAGFYSLCPSAGYQTDVTVKALKSDQTALRTITLNDVPFSRNRMTTYSGTMFANTRSMSLDFNTDWSDAYEATW